MSFDASSFSRFLSVSLFLSKCSLLPVFFISLPMFSAAPEEASQSGMNRVRFRSLDGPDEFDAATLGVRASPCCCASPLFMLSPAAAAAARPAASSATESARTLMHALVNELMYHEPRQPHVFFFLP
jgi:hypothetical protein